jgi:CRISPR system Cascade subunit CasD
MEALGNLQARIEYAARWDVNPDLVVDYHTVDLGQPRMREPGWTSRGIPEHRGGGDARHGIHERFRHYWANGVMTVAARLVGDESPDTAFLESALKCPSRPLFLGRKNCLPAAPLLAGKVEAGDVLEALRMTARVRRPGTPAQAVEMVACWPFHIGMSGNSQEVTVYDLRDWRNQVHAGSRVRVEGFIRELSK